MSSSTHPPMESDSEAKPGTRRAVEKPAQVETEAERRQMFAYIVDKYGKGASKLARASGIQRVHIAQLIGGQKEILSMQMGTVRKFLSGLSISDDAARSMLKIPDDVADRWYTDRPRPMGGGPDSAGVETYVLEMPLTGDAVSCSAGYEIKIDTRNISSGLVLIVLPESLHAVRHDAVPAGAEVLGQLLGVDTSIRRE